jgi:hypothetical protein
MFATSSSPSSDSLQDISTLSLVVRLITSLTPSMSEPAVLANSFELLCAFDEVVSLGYKENASLQQIRNVLEGESHEEKIQDIIARVSSPYAVKHIHLSVSG